MADYSSLKQELFDYCVNYIESQIEHVQNAINSAQESAKNESKSSAGDKHETGKSLMQLEQENNAQHLANMLDQKRVVSILSSYRLSGKVTLGSLVVTDNGAYYIALGIGLAKGVTPVCYIISPTAPIGKLLIGKSTDDLVAFNGKQIQIKEII